jgi:uncharacterized membrane protein HdeD (DUF308 family)
LIVTPRSNEPEWTMTEIPADWESPVVERESALFPWWLVLVLGIVSIGFGIVVLVWPGPSLAVMAIIVGCWLLLAGIARIIGAFLPGTVGQRVLSAIVGVVLVIAGMICLRNLVTGLAVLALMVAFTWLFGGLTTLVTGFQTAGGLRVALVALGVLSVLLGLVFLFVPTLSLAGLILLTGISAVIVGAGELVVAFQIRRTRIARTG